MEKVEKPSINQKVEIGFGVALEGERRDVRDLSERV